MVIKIISQIISLQNLDIFFWKAQYSLSPHKILSVSPPLSRERERTWAHGRHINSTPVLLLCCSEYFRVPQDTVLGPCRSRWEEAAWKGFTQTEADEHPQAKQLNVDGEGWVCSHNKKKTKKKIVAKVRISWIFWHLRGLLLGIDYCTLFLEELHAVTPHLAKPRIHHVTKKKLQYTNYAIKLSSTLAMRWHILLRKSCD